MDPRGSFICALIEKAPRALASGALDRAATGGAAFLDALGDTEVRLRHLGQALATGRRQLFREDVHWMKVALAARGAGDETLRENLRGIAAELGERLPPTHGPMAVEYVEETLAELDSLPVDSEPHVFSEAARGFANALVEGDEAAARRAADEHVAAGRAATAFCVDVISPAQRELGRLWQIGQLDAGVEHIGSRIVESILCRLQDAVTTGAGHRKVLVGCGASEVHDIGARMAALAFTESGWSTVFYGTSLPAEALAETIRAHEPDILALSIQLTLHLTPTARLISALREMGVATPILVGGAPFRRVKDLWQVLGADGDAGSLDTAAAAAEAVIS